MLRISLRMDGYMTIQRLPFSGPMGLPISPSSSLQVTAVRELEGHVWIQCRPSLGSATLRSRYHLDERSGEGHQLPEHKDRSGCKLFHQLRGQFERDIVSGQMGL